MSHSDLPQNWIFLRGLGRERRHWGDFIARCEQQLGWRCHCLDLPGFGEWHTRRSPLHIAGIRGLVQQKVRQQAALLGLSPPYGVMGLSLGGMVALDWARSAPESVTHCVLINASSADSPCYRRLQPRAWRYFCGALLAQDVRRQEAMVLRMVSNQRAGDAALLNEWVSIREQAALTRRNILRQLLAAARYRVPELPPLNGLVIASRGDRMVSWRCSDRIAALTGWPLALHAGAGHDLPVDDGDWLVKTLARWSANCVARMQ